MSALSLSLEVVPDIPLVMPGDNLSQVIMQSLADNDVELIDNDVVVIAQKIVSKAEGQIVNLKEINPGIEAIRLADEVDKDPRLVQLILNDSNRVVRSKPGVLIVEHRSGIVMANAGIDHSNVENNSDDQFVTLLPQDADDSADRIRHELEFATNKKLAVIINDSVGRPWRKGTVGITIGCSGILALKDLRGEQDLYGTTLEVSETADADALASAACLLMGEAAEASPVVLVRGFALQQRSGNSSELLRDAENDMFR